MKTNIKREIKFRLYDIEEKKFYHYDLLTNSGRRKLVDDDWFNPELQQYTGLLDKNGKEIYEGDILKDDENCLLEVKFGKLPLDKSGDCVCTYEAWYGKCYGKLGQAPYHECQEIGDLMEIIGNIYQDSQLLITTL